MTAATAVPMTGNGIPLHRPPLNICNVRMRKRCFTFSALSNSNGGDVIAPDSTAAASALRNQPPPPLVWPRPRDSCLGFTRRGTILQMPLSFAAALLQLHILSPAQALEEEAEAFRVYSDDANKYKISIPQDWQVGTGDTNGVKSITAFYPEEASTSNVSVLITGLGPDFTRLESFGKVDAFAENLVSGLDRSWQRHPGVAAKLIDSKSANGLYYIEYTLQKPGESCRHIYTALGIGNNGWYNRLYTVTGQFFEEESGTYNSKIEKAVQSFRLT